MQKNMALRSIVSTWKKQRKQTKRKSFLKKFNIQKFKKKKKKKKKKLNKINIKTNTVLPSSHKNTRVHANLWTIVTVQKKKEH